MGIIFSVCFYLGFIIFYSFKDGNFTNVMHNTIKQPLNIDLDFTS